MKGFGTDIIVNLLLNDQSGHVALLRDLSLTRQYRVSRNPRLTSQFQHAVDMKKQILFDSLIYSPSFSPTQARRRIQSRNTLWTSPKEAIPYLCDRLLNSIIRGKVLISQDLLSHPKEPKVAQAYIW
jgi:hypothetical protein